MLTPALLVVALCLRQPTEPGYGRAHASLVRGCMRTSGRAEQRRGPSGDGAHLGSNGIAGVSGRGDRRDRPQRLVARCGRGRLAADSRCRRIHDPTLNDRCATSSLPALSVLPGPCRGHAGFRCHRWTPPSRALTARAAGPSNRPRPCSRFRMNSWPAAASSRQPRSRRSTPRRPLPPPFARVLGREVQTRDRLHATGKPGSAHRIVRKPRGTIDLKGRLAPASPASIVHGPAGPNDVPADAPSGRQCRLAAPRITASATEAMRDATESAREVSTTGTFAPSTTPPQSPPPT